MPGPESTPTGAAEEAAQENQEQTPAVTPVETPTPVAENPAPTEITRPTPPAKKEKGHPFFRGKPSTHTRYTEFPTPDKILDREKNYSKSEDITQLINQVLSGEYEAQQREVRVEQLRKNGLIGEAGSYLGAEGRWVRNQATGQMELQGSIFDYNPDNGTLQYNAWRDVGRRAANVGAKVGVKGAITAGVGVAVGLVTGGVGLAPIAAMTGKTMLGSGLGRGGVEVWRHFASREVEYLQKIESADIRFFQKARELASRALLYMPPYGEVSGLPVRIEPNVPIGQEDSDLRTQPITNDGRQSPPYPDKNPDIGEAVSNLTKTEYEQARFEAITDLVNFVHSYEQLSFIDDRGTRKLGGGEEKERELDANGQPIPPGPSEGPVRFVGGDGTTILPLNEATTTVPQVNRGPSPESNIQLETNVNPYSGPPLRGVELQQTSLTSEDFEKVKDLWDKYAAEKSMWEQRSEKGELIGGLSFLAMNLLSGAWEKLTGKLYQELGDRLQDGDIVNRINTDNRWWIRHPIELLRNSDQLVYHFKSVGEQLASQAAGATQALSETGGKIGEFGGHLLGKTGLAVDYGLLNRAQELVGTQVAAAVASMFARFGIGNSMRKRNEEMMNEHRERNVHNDERWRERRQPDEPESLESRLREQAKENMKSFPSVGETWVLTDPKTKAVERFEIIELIEDAKRERILVKVALEDPNQTKEDFVKIYDLNYIVENGNQVRKKWAKEKSEETEEKTDNTVKVDIPPIIVNGPSAEAEAEAAEGGGDEEGEGKAKEPTTSVEAEEESAAEEAATETAAKTAEGEAAVERKASAEKTTDNGNGGGSTTEAAAAAEKQEAEQVDQTDNEIQKREALARTNGFIYRGRVEKKPDNQDPAMIELMERGVKNGLNPVIEQSGRYFKVLGANKVNRKLTVIEIDSQFKITSGIQFDGTFDSLFNPKYDTYFYSPQRRWQTEAEAGTSAASGQEKQEPPETKYEIISIDDKSIEKFREDVTKSALGDTDTIHIIEPTSGDDYVLETVNPNTGQYIFSGGLKMYAFNLVLGKYKYYVETKTA